jgi:ArsR family transcriptional regulator
MGKTAKTQFNAEQLRISATILRALAHPLRLRLLQLIQARQPASVQTIYTEMKLEQSVASQHLRILRDAGLVQTQRQGKFVEYLLDEALLLRAGLVASQLANTTQK